MGISSRPRAGIRDRQPQPVEPDFPQSRHAIEREQQGFVRGIVGGPAELANQANSTSRAPRPRDGKRQPHGEIARHLGSRSGAGMGVGQFPGPAEADQVVRHATFSLPPRSGRPPAAMATKARGARFGRGTMTQESYPFAMVFALTTHYSQRLPEATRLSAVVCGSCIARLVRPSQAWLLLATAPEIWRINIQPASVPTSREVPAQCPIRMARRGFLISRSTTVAYRP